MKLEASLETPALAATAPVPLSADSIGVAFRAYIPSALEFVTQHLRAGVTADPADIEGFSAFLERYRKAMPLEMLAPEVL
jgi:hypothetical protein